MVRRAPARPGQPRIIMASDNAHIRLDAGAGRFCITRCLARERAGAPISVEKASDTFVPLHPATSSAGESSVGGKALPAPPLRSRRHDPKFLRQPRRQVTASLAAPSGIGPFTVTTRSEKTFADLAIGVDILRRAAMTVRLEYGGPYRTTAPPMRLA